MRCQDIERLMFEASERELSRGEQLAVDRHLARCAACASFRNYWEEIQFSLQSASEPKLPSGLEERVRLACHEELNSKLRRLTWPALRTPSAPVPWPIWAALAALIILTLAFLIPGIEEFLEKQSFSLRTDFVLVLILQNALMLFFAPIIMRSRGRGRSISSRVLEG